MDTYTRNNITSWDHPETIWKMDTTKKPTEFVNINFVAKEIWIPLDFVTRQGMVAEKALVDCGANENCIDIKTAQKLGVKP
jgi:hypothetical protein